MAGTTTMGQTTKLLIQKLWDKKSKRRALSILLLSDLCLFLVGGYLIVSWVRIKGQGTVSPAVHTSAKGPEPQKTADSGASEDKAPGRVLQRKGARLAARESREGQRVEGHDEGSVKGEPEPDPRSGESGGDEVKEAGEDNTKGGDETKDEGETEGQGEGENGTKGGDEVKGENEAEGGDEVEGGGTDTKADREQGQNFLFAVRGALRKRSRAFKRCYTEALKLHGKRISGGLQLKFRLKDNGAVESVTTVKNTTESPSLEKCLLRVTARIRFPKPPKGVKEFLYPLSFTAQR